MFGKLSEIFVNNIHHQIHTEGIPDITLYSNVINKSFTDS